MQVGAPPHIALPLQRLLCSPFGEDRNISYYFNHAWPPRSPDPTPCDFRLFGFLKSKVHPHQPSSLASAKMFLPNLLPNAVNEKLKNLCKVLETKIYVQRHGHVSGVDFRNTFPSKLEEVPRFALQLPAMVMSTGDGLGSAVDVEVVDLHSVAPNFKEYKTNPEVRVVEGCGGVLRNASYWFISLSIMPPGVMVCGGIMFGPWTSFSHLTNNLTADQYAAQVVLPVICHFGRPATTHYSSNNMLPYIARRVLISLKGINSFS
ncbi:uncharacterized protein TNCV_4420081 [Trichonephila clavipes]|nr:uncharacterized protein TNCV_4420081 [Trichonephila clavipes]